MTPSLDAKRHRNLPSSIGLPLFLLSLANMGYAGPADDESAPPVRIQLTDTKDDISSELEFSDAMLHAATGKVDAALTAFEQISDGDVAKTYSKAMWLLNEGKIDEGVTLLEQICNDPEAPVDTKKYLATAYLHSRKPDAAKKVINEYLNDHSTDAYAIYLRGVAEVQLDDLESASETFQMAGYSVDEAQHIQLAMMQVPVDAQQRLLTVRPPEGRQASQSPSIGRGQLNRPFNFTVLMATDYDSNVPLRPFFTGLGSNFKHSDARFVTAASGDLKVVDREEVNAGLLAGIYNTYQYNLTQFNIGDYMGGGYTNVLLTDKWLASMRYEFHTTLVNDTQFSNDHRLTPSVTRLQENGHTTGYFEYNPIDNRAPKLIDAQNQSADTYRVGATQALYTFGGQGRLYAGYQYADTFAQGTDFDRHSNMITGRIERPMAKGWIWDLDTRYAFDDYANGNSLDFNERARKDRRVEVRTGLQKNFKLPVSFRLDYTYIDNSSNTANLFGVRFYDYERHVISTQLIFSTR